MILIIQPAGNLQIRAIEILRAMPDKADVIIADVIELRLIERLRFIEPDEVVGESVFGRQPPPPKFSSFARARRERRRYRPHLVIPKAAFRNYHFLRR
jgi:hypothetical protein